LMRAESPTPKNWMI